MTIFQWQDLGENVDVWNKQFPKKLIPLFSEKGFGIWLPCPHSEPEESYCFVPSTPILADVVTVLDGMHYPKEVEEVFYIDFLNTEGDRHPSPSLRIERSGNFLRPVPIVCGLSPTQIRQSIALVDVFLSNRITAHTP